MRPEELYLLDIIEAADSIREFLRGVDRERFMDDDQIGSSVLHKLMIIGEAASRLPVEFRARHPDMEWGDIVRFRNIIVHAYFSVRWPSVWTAATKDTPALRTKVADILAAEYPEVKLLESGS